VWGEGEGAPHVVRRVGEERTEEVEEGDVDCLTEHHGPPIAIAVGTLTHPLGSVERELHGEAKVGPQPHIDPHKHGEELKQLSSGHVLLPPHSVAHGGLGKVIIPVWKGATECMVRWQRSRVTYVISTHDYALCHCTDDVTQRT
jgi:hypothetical protein